MKLFENPEEKREECADLEAGTAPTSPRKAHLRVLSLINLYLIEIIVVLLLGFAILMIVMNKSTTMTYMGHFFDWLKLNPYWGPLLLVLLYTVGIPLCLPITFPSVAAGYVFSVAFHPVNGFLVTLASVTAGALCGGSVNYWLSRTLFRRCARDLLIMKFSALNALDFAIRAEGLKIAAMLRLTPISFSLVSYLLGVTELCYKDYLIGTLVIIIPASLWAYVGAQMQNLQELMSSSNQGSLAISFLVVSIIVLVLLLAYITCTVKRLLASTLSKNNQVSALNGKDS